jgi:hypothetical protein
MPNGKPGDSPLSDMLVHGLHPFPPDMEAMLREILSLQPEFPDGRRPYAQQVEWMERFDAWARGNALDDGRTARKEVLGKLHSRDPGGA